MTSASPSRLALAIPLAVLQLATAHAADHSSLWNGGTGIWSDPANWTTLTAPGTFPNNGAATYDATLSSGGSITLDQNITVKKLALSNGLLTGDFNITTEELFTWTGGNMTGSGVTQANGGMQLGVPNDNFNNYSMYLDGRTLNNAAGQTAAFSGDRSYFYVSNGAQINNAGTFLAQNNTFIGYGGGSPSIFNNTGVFTRNNGTGTIAMGLSFNNTGVVNVQTGQLTLAGGDGGSTTGDFNVSGGATLDFQTGFSLGTTSDIAGAGNVSFGSGITTLEGSYNIGGTTTIAGGTVDFKAPVTNLGNGPLNQTGGILMGSGDVAVDGLLSWTGGNMTGTGTTQANGGIQLGGVPPNQFVSYSLYLDGRTLNNTAGQTATFLGDRTYLYTSNGAEINNAGTFLAQNNTFIGYGGGSPSKFNNSGVFTRDTGTGTIAMGLSFNNSGVVNVQTGQLTLAGGDGGSTTGDFNVSNGATLDFQGGYSLGATSDIAGAGNVNFGSGATTVSGTYGIGGTTSVAGGTVDFNAPITSLGSGLTVTGGTINLNSNNQTVSSFNLLGGTLGGTASLTSTGLTTWNQGTMNGSGTTQANGGIQLGGVPPNQFVSYSMYLDGRTLNNAAGQTATFLGDRTYLYTSNGAQINNAGTFLAQNNTFIGYGGGSPSKFNNSGVFTRDTGTGTITMGLSFNNSGVVNVQTGQLTLAGGDGGSTTGDFTISSDATLSFQGGFSLGATSDIAGAGNVSFSDGSTIVDGTYDIGGITTAAGGTVDFNAPVTSLGHGLTVVNGTINLNSNDQTVSNFDQLGGTLGGSASLTSTGLMTWNQGTMNGSGITQADGGMLLGGVPPNQFVSYALYLDGRTLNNKAGQTATFLGDRTYLYTSNGAQLNNAGTFLAQNNTFIGYGGGTPSTFNNSGIFTRDTGTGTISMGLTFDNSGVVNVQTGQLALAGGDGGSTMGDFNVSSGATLNFQSAFSLSSTSDIAGAGNVSFTSGTTTVGGTYNIGGTTTIESGTAEFNVPAVTGPLTMPYSGSTLTGSGKLTANGLLHWTGGTMTGSGITEAKAGMQIGVPNDSFNNYQMYLDGRTLSNAAGQAATFSGDRSYLFLSNGAEFENAGTFIAQGNTSIGHNGGLPATFTNTGTFTRNTGTNIFNIYGLTFDNPGTVNVQTGELWFQNTEVSQYTGTALTGGRWRVFGDSEIQLPTTGTGIATNDGDITLSGVGSALRAGVDSDLVEDTLVSNSGALRVLANRDYASAGALTNSGVLELGGGTFSAPGLTNTGSGEIMGYGSISLRPTNSGSVRSAGGPLVLADGIDGGSGTVQTDAGSTLNLSGGTSGSDADFLINNGNLILGSNDFTVGLDYTNGNFGTGNSFNPRANVTGSGSILAAGTLTQTLSGDVTGGSTASASVAFGNLHVGDSATQTYRINAVGSSSPSLRGGLQTGVNGGNLTDSRLEGDGVGPGVFGPITPGSSSGDLDVTFAPDSAGPLTSQTVRLLNNLDNVGDQTLTITGAAFRYALPAVTPEPVAFGNFHVGDAAPTQFLSLTNAVPNDGYSEALNASIGAATGGVLMNGGSFNLLGPGATDTTSLSVAISTAVAGSQNGTATLSLISDGTGSSELGLTGLPDRTVTVTGGVYRLAQPTAHTPEPVSLGNFHVGDTAIQSLSLTNAAPADGFSEALRAALGGTTGAAVTNNGTFGPLAPGATNATSLAVGIDTTTAGTKSGTAALSLTSDGVGSSGLGLTPLASQSVNVSGSVYRLAQAGSLSPVSFGNFHVGDAAPSQMLSLTNAVPNDGFSEALTISLDGVTGGVTADGDPISLLAPGGTNSTNLSVGIDTTTAGAKNGLATLNLTSDGAGSSGLGQTALASQSVNVIGSVYRLAQAGSVAPVAFGNFHVGDASPSRLLSLTNAAPNDGFSEALTISINGTTGGVTAGGGPISLLAPGATNGSSLTVGIDTTAAGSKNGLATLALTSDGAGSSGLGQTALTSQSVAVSGSVFRLANPTTPDGTTVDFGIVHVGDVVQRTVGVTNAAVNDGFSESLNASISSTTGAASGIGSINDLTAGGASNSLTVSLDTATAGGKSGSVTLAFSSDGAGTSGLPSTALASQEITLDGLVNEYANPVFLLDAGPVTFTGSGISYTLDFGMRVFGDPAPTARLSLLNSVAAPADSLAGTFEATAPHFMLVGFEGFSGIQAGQSLGNLTASLRTDALGVFTETLVLQGSGQNASGYDGALADVTILLRGEVVVPEPASTSLLGLALLLLWRRRRQAADQSGSASVP